MACVVGVRLAPGGTALAPMGPPGAKEEDGFGGNGEMDGSDPGDTLM